MRRVSCGEQVVPIWVDYRHIVDLVRCPHILVGGATGSGKSYLMKSMLCDVLESSKCKVIVVDPKSVDYQFVKDGMRPWEGRSDKSEDEEVKSLWSMRGLRLYVRDDIDSMEVSRMLNSLCDEMSMRYRFLMSRGYVEWKDYELEQEKREEQDGQEYGGIWGDERIVLFIDELADLIYWDRQKVCDVLLGYGDGGEDSREYGGVGEDGVGGMSRVEFMAPPFYGGGCGGCGVEGVREGYGVEGMSVGGWGDRVEVRMDDKEWRLMRGSIEKYVIRLAMLGRAAGIHLVLGTQRPSSEILSGQLRANIPTRVCLPVSNPIERGIILGNRCGGMGQRVLYYGGHFEELERDLG